MAYNAPELLLVGAAQNLVLGSKLVKEGEFQNIDPDTEAYADGPNTDGNRW